MDSFAAESTCKPVAGSPGASPPEEGECAATQHGRSIHGKTLFVSQPGLLAHVTENGAPHFAQITGELGHDLAPGLPRHDAHLSRARCEGSEKESKGIDMKAAPELQCLTGCDGNQTLRLLGSGPSQDLHPSRSDLGKDTKNIQRTQKHTELPVRGDEHALVPAAARSKNLELLPCQRVASATTSLDTRSYPQPHWPSRVSTETSPSRIKIAASPRVALDPGQEREREREKEHKKKQKERNKRKKEQQKRRKNRERNENKKRHLVQGCLAKAPVTHLA